MDAYIEGYESITSPIGEIDRNREKYGYSVYRLTYMSGVVPPLSITKEVLYINREFVNTMIDIYNELMHYPPFPGWKDGLEELWN